jgi:hypothetical protein
MLRLVESEWLCRLRYRLTRSTSHQAYCGSQNGLLLAPNAQPLYLADFADRLKPNHPCTTSRFIVLSGSLFLFRHCTRCQPRVKRWSRKLYGIALKPDLTLYESQCTHSCTALDHGRASITGSCIPHLADNFMTSLSPIRLYLQAFDELSKLQFCTSRCRSSLSQFQNKDLHS